MADQFHRCGQPSGRPGGSTRRSHAESMLNGWPPLERLVAFAENASVHMILETDEEARDVHDDDPTGLKPADELIGLIKDGPKESLGEEHEEYLYRK